MTDKEPGAFRTISEVAAELDLPAHVLRFWETKFNQIRPMKRSGGRRFYRPEDIALVRLIREMLYGQGYTIKGVQRILKERGVRSLLAEGVGPAPPSERIAAEADAPDEDEAGADAPSGFRPAGDFLQRLRAVEAELRDCARLLASARVE